MRVRATLTGGAIGAVLAAVGLVSAGAPAQAAAGAPRCLGQPATIVAHGGGTVRGTSGRDVIVGTAGDDTIKALGGDDVVCGLGGDDRISGGPGADRLDGGGGDDQINGGAGDDNLSGRGGSDHLLGGPGNDKVSGGAGDDVCANGPGKDRLRSCNEQDDAPDAPPSAVADTATVPEDSPATALPVLANDLDPDGGPEAVASVTQPAHGFVVVTGGGSGLTYRPAADYCNDGVATDDFTYSLAPGGSSATVQVRVTCIDDGPGAVDDTATVAEDAAATAIPVLANDTDVDGGPQTIASVTQAAHGTVVVTGAGSGLTYRPAADYCNDGTPTDDFTYTLNGGGTATVRVTVTCTDDPPVAVDDTATVAEDAAATAIPVLANDTDVDGGPAAAVASVTQPAHGTVVVTGAGTGLTYQPQADYCNDGTPTDDFTYTLVTGGTATVRVTVTCTDDPPVAVDDTATVAEDAAATAIPVLANDTDVDGGPETIASVTQAAHGTVVVTGGGTGLTYFPAAGYCAPAGTPDTFTYTLNGGSTATVAVGVTCLSASVAPSPDTIASGTVGTPIARSWTVQNQGPAFTGRLISDGPLASARLQRRTIAANAQQQLQLTVPPGTTALRVSIGNAAALDADLDLFLYDCTAGSCVLRGSSAGGSATEAVAVSNPAAGTWIALVDGYTVPPGSTDYDILDELVSPAYGTLTVSDADAVRSSGGSWTVPGTVTPIAAPGAGRFLRGTTSVVTTRGTRIASGVVTIQSVT